MCVHEHICEKIEEASLATYILAHRLHFLLPFFPLYSSHSLSVFLSTIFFHSVLITSQPKDSVPSSFSAFLQVNDRHSKNAEANTNRKKMYLYIYTHINGVWKKSNYIQREKKTGERERMKEESILPTILCVLFYSLFLHFFDIFVLLSILNCHRHHWWLFCSCRFGYIGWLAGCLFNWSLSFQLRSVSICLIFKPNLKKKIQFIFSSSTKNMTMQYFQ